VADGSKSRGVGKSWLLAIVRCAWFVVLSALYVVLDAGCLVGRTRDDEPRTSFVRGLRRRGLRGVSRNPQAFFHFRALVTYPSACGRPALHTRSEQASFQISRGFAARPSQTLLQEDAAEGVAFNEVGVSMPLAK
jgi:hypothetical protein